MPWRLMEEQMYRSTFSWPRHCRWWVVSIMPQFLCSRRKIPWCPLDRSLSGSQSRSELDGKVKIVYLTDLSVVHPVVSRFIDCAIADCSQNQGNVSLSLIRPLSLGSELYSYNCVRFEQRLRGSRSIVFEFHVERKAKKRTPSWETNAS
jgi:hypothetical protein